MFLGYKKGQGRYEEFIFCLPTGFSENFEAPEGPNLNHRSVKHGNRQEGPVINEDKYKGKGTSIILEFFKTEEFERKDKGPKGLRDVK